MKLVRTTSSSSGMLPLAPVIDVVLLLLLFFLLSSNFVLQPGVSVSLPFSKFEMAPQNDALIVTAEPGETKPRIYFRNMRLTIDEFAASLPQAGTERNRALIVRADRRVAYEHVVRIMNVGLTNGFQVVLATTPNQR